MKKEFNPLFTSILQVGFVVKNLKKTMDQYIKIGIGPWYVLKFSPENVENMHIGQNKKDYSMNIGVCPIGDVRFELIEPINESIYSEFLERYGEGMIHHLKFEVCDYNRIVKHLECNGLKSIQSGQQIGGQGRNIYSYWDTGELGFILEIAKITQNFAKPPPDYWYSDRKEYEPLFYNLAHINIAVKDLEKNIDDFSKILGIKEWQIENRNLNKIKNNKINKILKVATCDLGTKEIRLIQPLEKSFFSIYFDKYGDIALHSLGMEVENYDLAIDFFKIKNIDSSRYEAGC